MIDEGDIFAACEIASSGLMDMARAAEVFIGTAEQVVGRTRAREMVAEWLDDIAASYRAPERPHLELVPASTADQTEQEAPNDADRALGS